MNTTTQKRNIRGLGRWGRLAALSCCLVGISLGQNPTVRTPSPLPPDHPELYSSFFTFHDDFSQWLDSRISAAPARAALLSQSAANYFGVEQSESVKVRQVTRSVAGRLRGLQAEVQAYVDRTVAAGGTPERAAFRGFEARRQRILSAGVDELRLTLTPAAWIALRRYINVQLRGSINPPLQPAPAPPPAP